jgi:DNA-directed RNA polymerase beta subunit
LVKLARVRAVSVRKPQIGDKFTSRHGQKCIIAMIYRQEDMPQTREGIAPDIIVNPHAIPSRMTIGQLIEQLFGKKSAIVGNYQDGTPFRDVQMKKLQNDLSNFKYNRNGNEVLYHPASGKRIKNSIYMGIIYYLKLNHLAKETLHVRTRGKKQIMNRAPVQGKWRGGGQRVGFMEIGCMIDQGCANWIHELLKRCDECDVFFCSKCGLEAIYNFKTNQKFCNLCKNGNNVYRTKIPYAHKLLSQELQSMGIISRKLI